MVKLTRQEAGETLDVEVCHVLQWCFAAVTIHWLTMDSTRLLFVIARCGCGYSQESVQKTGAEVVSVWRAASARAGSDPTLTHSVLQAPRQESR